MDLNYKKPNKSTSTLTVRPTCKSPRGKILFVHIDFQGFAFRREREKKKCETNLNVGVLKTACLFRQL
jgi:hypothetical protein